MHICGTSLTCNSFGAHHLQKQPPVVFYEKALLKNFAIFTGKRLCWSPTLLKGISSTGVFLAILQNFQEHLF